MRKKIAGKIMAVMMAAVMTVSAAGCGSSSDTATTADSTEVTEAAEEAPAEEAEGTEEEVTAEENAEDSSETAESVEEAVEEAAGGADLTGKKVGFSALMMSSEFFTDMSNQMETYFTDKGMTYDVADAAGNAQTQIQTVENFVSMGCDYIICFVVDSASIGDTLKKARESGAFVIVIGTVLEDKDAADVCISISQRESGEVEAQMASDWIDATFPDAEDGSIKVGLLTNSENEDAVSRCDGLRTIEEIN